MKKRKLHLLLIGILIVSAGMLSCSSGGGGGSAPPPYSGARQWTYMVYMGADNNLSDAGLSDLNEMEMVGSSAGVAVVVQAEFSPRYSGSGIPTDTYRILIEKDNDPNTVNSNGNSIGNVDMANPATLTAFINWTKTNYPAPHYALVIWDHGAGWKAKKFASPARGAVQDETSGTFMSLPDLAKGVRDSGVHFDVINFDACLMAMYEVAYEFNGLTDYMAFSEQTEPGEGDPYDTILGSLGGNPLMTARDLASTIVDKYDQFYTTNDRGGTTKSAVDMSKLAALDTKLLTLAAALKNDGASSAVVLQAESNTQEYSYPSNHDIWDFSDYLVNSAAGTAVKTAAADVKTAVTSMVVDNQTNGTDMAHSHGLAIYLPSASETNAQELADYALLASNKTTRAAATGTWGSYLETLLTGAGGGTATYDAGNFGFYASWTNVSDQSCDADLDLYVWEPDGAGGGAWYAPYMGQTSPNGFFSPDSSVSGKSEEYYLANAQVLAGDYYLMVNFYGNGASCTQAKARLYYYDPAFFGDSNWHEATAAIGVNPAVASPVLLDLSNRYTGQALTNGLSDLNNYSDWWVPFFITKAPDMPQFMSSGNFPVVNKRTEMIIRYKKGTRLFGSGL
jgi:hypothetical protein